jgi:hypothetical protein
VRKKKIENHGIFGWIATTLVVVIFDYWAIKTGRQTMSKAFKSGLFRKHTSLFVAGGWVILTWHLIHPPKLKHTDLFSIILDRNSNG